MAIRLLHITVAGDPDPFIDGPGNVKSRLSYYQTGPVPTDWQVHINLGVWNISNRDLFP
ncbi:MAG: hypothetical protein WAO58_10840 [Fimbriimonadaceae bacterium]